MSRAPDPIRDQKTRDRARAIIGDRIDELVALLDWIDGDPDVEPVSEDEGAQCDDEGADDADLEDGCDAEGLSDDNGLADLGGAVEQGFTDFGSEHPYLNLNQSLPMLDAEGADDDREPDVDDEPSLGSFDRSVDQTAWGSAGLNDDREQDDSDLEDGCDAEASTNDNGLADLAGAAQQGFAAFGYEHPGSWLRVGPDGKPTTTERPTRPRRKTRKALKIKTLALDWSAFIPRAE